MNAAQFTHGLKMIGGNTRMWVGVLVITVAILILYQLEQDRRNRMHQQFHE